MVQRPPLREQPLHEEHVLEVLEAHEHLGVEGRAVDAYLRRRHGPELVLLDLIVLREETIDVARIVGQHGRELGDGLELEVTEVSAGGKGKFSTEPRRLELGQALARAEGGKRVSLVGRTYSKFSRDGFWLCPSATSNMASRMYARAARARSIVLEWILLSVLHPSASSFATAAATASGPSSKILFGISRGSGVEVYVRLSMGGRPVNVAVTLSITYIALKHRLRASEAAVGV